MIAGDCYIVAGGILGLDPEGFAEVGGGRRGRDGITARWGGKSNRMAH